MTMPSEVEHRDGEPVIVTPVASILSRIEGNQAAGFARVESALAGKADKGDIIRLETTQREHGDRLVSLERDKAAAIAEGDRGFSRRQARWAILLGIGIIFSSIGAALITAFVHG